jgi:acyl carrier protein
MPAIEQELRKFVVDNFLFGQQEVVLTNVDSFLEKGLIDSTGVLELVAFLEKKYGIKIRDDEIVPEHLDSLDRIARFIEKKTRVQG